MAIYEHAEALRLMLLMGVVSKSDVIAWADEVIAVNDSPPNWLLDLSLAANAENEQIDRLIRDVPCAGSATDAAYMAMAGFAEAFNAGKMDGIQAAAMLARWAASARVDHDDWTVAMIPVWQAEEIGYYTSIQDVVAAVKKCIEHFE